MSGERVLIVDDEPQIRRALRTALIAHGYEVEVAEDGRTGLEAIAAWAPDAVVLDLVMPGVDGFEVLRQTRAWSDVPVVVLSARGQEADKVAALDGGADDYLTKPFDFRELLARLRALLRRGHRPVTPAVLTVGPLTLDTRARRVRRSGRLLELTAREYSLLEYLVLHANAVVGRAALSEHVWEAAHEPASNAVDVCVKRLRQKIDRRGQPSLILTRRGEGYMLAAPSAT